MLHSSPSPVHHAALTPGTLYPETLSSEDQRVTQLLQRENSELQVEHTQRFTPMTQGFRRLRQGDCCEFEANLSNFTSYTGCIALSCLKEKKKKESWNGKQGSHNEHVQSSVMACYSSTDNTLAPQIHFNLGNVSWWSQCIPEEHRGALFLMFKPIRNTEHILRSYCFLWMLKESDIPII